MPWPSECSELSSKCPILRARDSWRRSTSVRCSTNSSWKKCLSSSRMCRASLQRTDRAVSQLFASLGPESVSARQLPETQGRVEENRPRTRRLWSGNHRFVCPAISWTLDRCQSRLQARDPEACRQSGVLIPFAGARFVLLRLQAQPPRCSPFAGARIALLALAGAAAPVIYWLAHRRCEY